MKSARRALLVASLVLTVVLAMLVFSGFTADGRATVPVQVQLRDRISGAPIPGAEITANNRRSAASATTDASGRAIVEIEVPFSEMGNAFRRRREVFVAGVQIECAREGYIPSTETISKRVPQTFWFWQSGHAKRDTVLCSVDLIPIAKRTTRAVTK